MSIITLFSSVIAIGMIVNQDFFRAAIRRLLVPQQQLIPCRVAVEKTNTIIK